MFLLTCTFRIPPGITRDLPLFGRLLVALVMGVVFWMHGVISPYGRLQPLECEQYVSCTPCTHCVDSRLRCSAMLTMNMSSDLGA